MSSKITTYVRSAGRWFKRETLGVAAHTEKPVKRVPAEVQAYGEKDPCGHYMIQYDAVSKTVKRLYI